MPRTISELISIHDGQKQFLAVNPSQDSVISINFSRMPHFFRDQDRVLFPADLFGEILTVFEQIKFHLNGQTDAIDAEIVLLVGLEWFDLINNLVRARIRGSLDRPFLSVQVVEEGESTVWYQNKQGTVCDLQISWEDLITNLSSLLNQLSDEEIDTNRRSQYDSLVSHSFHIEEIKEVLRKRSI